VIPPRLMFYKKAAVDIKYGLKYWNVVEGTPTHHEWAFIKIL